MPHFGLMDADALGDLKAALQRARLHLRSGRRRLSQGKISAGLVTLYDALEQALEWYVSSPRGRESRGLDGSKERTSRSRYRRLEETGVLDGTFDFDAFDALVEKALREELPGRDCGADLEGVESVMRQLGVMPFDEKALPPEDPRTF